MFYMVLDQFISESDAINYGIILTSSEGLFNFIVVFLLHGFSTVYARRALLNPDEHRGVLIQPEEEVKEDENKYFGHKPEEDPNESIPFELSRSLLNAPKPSLEEYSRNSDIPVENIKIELKTHKRNKRIE